MSFPDFLVPGGTHWRVDAGEIEEPASRLTLTLCSVPPSAQCPVCAQPSTRIHSRYTRTVADLPCATLAVTLRLRVRRFFCPTPTCARAIFTERLPQVAELQVKDIRRVVIVPRRGALILDQLRR